MTASTPTIVRVDQYARTVHTPTEAGVLVAGGAATEAQARLLFAQCDWVLTAAASSTTIPWSGPIGFEDQLTGDGRLIETNALTWDDGPWPLRFAPIDNGGHDGAVVVGRILSIERQKGGVIWGTGILDLAMPFADQAAQQMQSGMGVSMDLDNVAFEVRVAADALDGPMMLPPLFADDETIAGQAEEEPETDEDGRVTVAKMNPDDEVMVTTSARIRAATQVSIPAFAGAILTLDADYLPGDAETDDVPEDDDEPDVPGGTSAAMAIPFSMAASSIPKLPPTAWFRRPAFTEPTPLIVNEDGQVYGHIAVWGTCHTAYTGQCVEPPHSPSDYAYFRVGAVLTDDGTEVAVGHLTLDTLHANANLRAIDTMAHYENTGRAVADVAAGEDEFGVWVAGALRPGVNDDQIRALRASPISGDWRRISGSLELVAALAVNVPGFPIPRPKGLVASGAMQSLVASGMLAPRKVLAPGLPGSLTADDLMYLKRLANRERQAMAVNRKRAAQMAADTNRARAAALARSIGVA